MAASNKKIDKIDLEIDKINQHLAQCRMDDQKKDHDKLITTETALFATIDELKEFKAENKDQHKEMNECKTALADKLEQISGNLNQGMMYIKNLQNGAKVRVGMTTAIISGVIATIIAAIIIYVGSTFFSEIQYKENNTINKILSDISKQLNRNSEQLHKFENTISEEIKNKDSE